MNRAPAGERLKAVLDTNIYVAGLTHPKGKTAILLDAAIRGVFTLVLSPAIMNELGRVLRDDFGWRVARVDQLVRTLAGVGQLVAPRAAIHAVAADPDDNRILECAVTGKAHVVVSNDRHLLNLGAFDNIPIVAAPDFRHIPGIK